MFFLHKKVGPSMSLHKKLSLLNRETAFSLFYILNLRGFTPSLSKQLFLRFPAFSQACCKSALTECLPILWKSTLFCAELRKCGKQLVMKPHRDWQSAIRPCELVPEVVVDNAGGDDGDGDGGGQK